MSQPNCLRLFCYIRPKNVGQKDDKLKKSYVKRYQVTIKFGSQKIFWSKEIGGPKIFLVQKTFESKTVLV